MNGLESDPPAAGSAGRTAEVGATPSGTVTLMFTDIEGSSRLEQDLGTATYAGLLRRHRDLMRAAFEAHGGVERGTEGDSFFVVFPTADGGVAAAAAAQRLIEAEPWPDGGRVRVRMGLHTGTVTFVGDDYVGIDINRAARIAAAAHGGQVVVSESTRGLAAPDDLGDVDFIDLGVHRLKDFEPIRLFQIVGPGLATDFPALRSLASPYAGLPAQPTSFVGRLREVAEVRRLLSGTRLLTLTGPGGTGKTRLGIAAAQSLLAEFTDGATWVGLGAIVDPDLVPSQIGQGLGLRDEGGRVLLDAIVERIGSGQLLLVLDNFEQILPAAPIVGTLLARCPNLKVIVTSRAVLHLAGEHEYPVPPLHIPSLGGAIDLDMLADSEAVALFLQRARAVRPDFELTAENAGAIVAICARLDGLPLAIELAAARVRILAPAAIAERLASSLGLLTGGARDLPARQQTLRGAVGWSYDLLEPVEQVSFGRLAVFAGGWTLEAAEQVADLGALEIDVLDALESLADKSLVRPVESPDGELRHRMLQVIREYGLERLEAAGETATIRDRHLAFFSALAERAESELIGHDAARWLDRLEQDHDNIRTALRWALDSNQVETGLIMAGRLWRFWHQRGHLGEGLAMTRDLLSCPGASGATRGRAMALNGAGGLAYWQNDFDSALGYYDEQLALARELADPSLVAEALVNAGFMAAVPHDFDRAIERFEEARDVSQAARDKRNEAAATSAMGMVYQLMGDLGRARAEAERAVVVSREAGDLFRVAMALGVLGRIARLADDRALSGTSTREALEFSAAVGDASGVAMFLDDLAHLALDEGAPERTLTLAAAAEGIRREIAGGAPPTLTGVGDFVERARGAVDEAAAAAAWDVGGDLSLADAIAFAQGKDLRPA